MQKKYLMSAAQERLFAIDQLQAENTTYNVPIIMKVENKVDREKLTQALNQVCERHEILRTNFSAMNGKMVQLVASQRKIELAYLQEDESQISEVIGHFVKPFDLTKDPLLRVCLYEYGLHQSLLMFDFHHIIFDGESMAPFFKDLVAYYNEETLPDLKLQYRNFSSWHNNLPMADQEAYWLEELSGDLPVTEIPSDFPRPKEKRYEGAAFTTEIDRETHQKIKGLALELETTDYVILFTAFMLLLSTYSTDQEVVVGTPVSGRTHPDVQEMIGMFVNTVVIREDFEQEATFNQLVAKVKDKFLSAYENQDYPFDQLVEALVPKRDASRNPLFDYTFVYQQGNSENLHLGQAVLSDYPLEQRISKFDVTLTASDTGDRYLFNWEYSLALFEEATIQRFAQHYLNLLDQVLVTPRQALSALSYLDQAEGQLLATWNSSQIVDSNKQSIIEQFESVCRANPDRLALGFGNQTLTYRELNEKANGFAALLRAKGIGREDIVALMMDRSPEMILGILGSLKAGAAYLPIAVDAPASRTHFILEDSQASLLITDQNNQARCQALKVKNLYVWRDHEVVASTQELGAETRPEDLAYIIYTSGTTGQPKGVMIENRNVLNLFDWFIPFSQVSKESVILQKATYTFDASVLEIFWALLSGGKLQLLTEEENKDYDQLLRVIKTSQVTHTLMVPTMFASLLDYVERQGYQHEFQSFETLYLGGETVSKTLIDRYRQLVGSEARVGNLYGPTEITVCGAGFMIPEEWQSEKIPIGKPVAGTQAYVMRHGQLCGIGVPGELCFSGKNNGRGYLNLPDMTKEVFSPSPFGEQTLYHTGDLARWREDGFLEYLGRVDEQVKIRGFRIEVGEIESQLKGMGIQEAAVVVKDIGNEPQLCAYLVTDSWDISQLRDDLKKELPEYMIPLYFTRMAEIPMTKNGKVDKAGLPLPEIQESEGPVVPTNPVEEQIYLIFQEVLGIERISIYDSFFELGGHSIKAMKLASLLQQRFEVSIALRDILEHETISALGQLIAAKETTKQGDIPTGVEGFKEMSSAQKRIFAIEQSTAPNTNYNMPFFLEVTGNLDVTRLTAALNQLIQRHESLRTYFDVVDGHFYQEVQDVTLTIEDYQAKESDFPEVYRAFIRPFDLSGSLIRVGLVQSDTFKRVLMIDLHHIIFDGFSLPLFFADLTRLYLGESLPPVALTYKDYSAWHQQLDLKDQQDYWLNELADLEDAVKLPVDPIGGQKKGQSICLAIDSNIIAGVKTLAKEQNVTEYMVFLTTLMILLSKYGRQEEVAVGTVVSGRTHPALEKIIGMFVNTVVIKEDIDQSKDFPDLLRKVKEKILKAHENQDYPFEKVIGDRPAQATPLFNVMFTSESDNGEVIELGDAQLTPVELTLDAVKFDLMVSVNNVKEDYGVMLDYDASLYQSESIQRVGQQYLTLLEKFVTSPKQPIKQISVLRDEELQLVATNQDQKEWPKEQSIVSLFEAAVRKTPDKVAIGSKEGKLTYRQLDEASNRVANRLLSLGVRKEEFVGVMAEKNSQTISAMLGILKAGAAYLPLDRHNPTERQDYILQDSQCRMMLTSGELAHIDSVEMIDLRELGDCSIERPEVAIEANQLAYLIYTSGTTGKPKGTMIEHRNVIPLVKETNYVDFDAIRVVQTGSLAFDASTFEIWGPLLNNGYLFLADSEALMDGYLLGKIIQEESINTMFMTVTLFNQMVATQVSAFDHLQDILIGGEKVSEKHIQGLRDHNPRIRITNIYGPTESTTFALTYVIPEEMPLEIPIGQPIAHRKAYVFDGDQLSGIGIPGELYLGGEGLARGYWKQDLLTNQKFVPNPYNPAERLYRTGDLVKVNGEGQIEFLGRIDNQIKLRGYRIELDEIKESLLRCERVTEAEVILAKVNETDHLCAYLSLSDQVTEQELKAYLKERLPDYMVPTVYTIMDKLPVNRNGKVDYQALPVPEIKGGSQVSGQPENQLQEVLVTVFQEVLAIPRIGIDDNFFELGGDSIKAISIVSKLRKAGYEVNVMTIMSERRIRLIAEKTKKATHVLTVSQEMVTGEAPLSPIQQTFFGKQLKEPNHFNQSFIFKTKERIDRDKLSEALNRLVEHHDSLRTSFTKVQRVLPYEKETQLKVGYHDVSQLEEKAGIEAIDAISGMAQKKLNIESGQLVEAQVFHTQNQDYLLVIVHHLVVDGVSWRILMEDLSTIYHGLVKDSPSLLPEKTTAFIDWIAALKRYSFSEEINQESLYWQTVLTKLSEHPKAAASQKETSRQELSWELTADLTRQLLYESTAAYETEINDLLLTAVSRAIHESLPDQTLSFLMEGHGRQEVEGTLIDRTVGWFTSIYPVLFEGIGGGISTDIQIVKETLNQVPNKGFGYGLLQTYRDVLPKAVEPEITFNYLGDFESLSEEANFFQMAKVRHGEDMAKENHFETPLLINTVVVAGKLQVQLHFNQSYSKEFAAELLANLGKQLEEVILHCRSLKEPQGNRIEDYLASHYQRRSELVTVAVDGKVQLLFIENLTTELYHSVTQALTEPFSQKPDYLVDMTKFQQDLVLTQESLRALVANPLLVKGSDSAPVNQDYTQRKQAGHYPGTTIQRSYLEQFEATIVRQSVPLSGYYTKEQILLAIQEIIRSQPSLRSSFYWEEGEAIVVEHEFDQAWPIAYLNHSYHNKGSVEALGKNQDGRQILSAITVIKESERQHQIDIQVSHSIWDKRSLGIFKLQLTALLKNQKSLESYPSIEAFARAIHQGKGSADNQQLIQAYDLEGFSQRAQRFCSENQIVSQQSELVVLALSPSLDAFYEKNTWAVLAYLLKIIAKESGQLANLTEDLPFYILQENRRYLGQGYDQAMGAFLDCIPVTIGAGHSVFDNSVAQRISRIQQLMRSNSLIDLIEEIAPLPIDRLYSINNQSAFGLTLEELKALQTLFEENEIQSHELLVNKYRHHLVLGVPTTINNQRKMQEVLEEACANLTNQIEESD